MLLRPETTPLAIRKSSFWSSKFLFAAGNSHANDIIGTLEMRFGNSKLILTKVVNDIQDLPSIKLKKINLVEFATKLKNSVTTVKSLNNVGFLYSVDLVNGNIRKII